MPILSLAYPARGSGTIFQFFELFNRDSSHGVPDGRAAHGLIALSRPLETAFPGTSQDGEDGCWWTFYHTGVKIFGLPIPSAGA